MLETIYKKPSFRDSLSSPRASILPRQLEKSDQKEYLKGMVHFGMLPEDDLVKVASRTVSQKLTKGQVLAVQGETWLNYIYVMRSGGVSLYEEKNNLRQLVGYIIGGEVFGGISLLMNDSLSLRTAIVEEETEAYLVPRQNFLEMCEKHKGFSSTFAENFSHNTSDMDLDAIINSGIIKLFLTSTSPFSHLVEEDIDRVAEVLSLVHYPKGSKLFSDRNKKVGYLYILYNGSASRRIEKKGGEVLHQTIGEGESYGGTSMLHNRGKAIGSLEAMEDTFFYLLPEKIFIKLCNSYPALSTFFAK